MTARHSSSILASWGPRSINLSNFNDETQLGLIKIREAWPSSPDDVDVKRKIRVNVRLDYGPPAFGMNVRVIHDQINHAVVMAARAFEPEFT